MALSLTDSDGTKVRVGIIGLTLPFNKADYVAYTDPISTAEKLYSQIKDSCDAVVALTHQFIDEDILLAERLPGLAVILGGHEHDMRFEQVGKVMITKAHANGKSAYVVKLVIDKNKKTIEVSPELRMLDETVPLDSMTDAVVKKWSDIANENYSSLGLMQKSSCFIWGFIRWSRNTTQLRHHQSHHVNSDGKADACPEAIATIVNAGSFASMTYYFHLSPNMIFFEH